LRLEGSWESGGKPPAVQTLREVSGLLAKWVIPAYSGLLKI